MGEDSSTEEDTEERAEEFMKALKRGEVDMSKYDTNVVPPEYAHFYRDGDISFICKPKELNRENVESDKGDPIAEYEFDVWRETGEALNQIWIWRHGGFEDLVREECESVELE